MADWIVKLSMTGFLLWVMVSGIALGAEVKIENRVGSGSSNGCNTRRDTSIIRLRVESVHKLLPLHDDVGAGGNDPSYPAEGVYIAAGSDSTVFNTSATTYRVVIELGSWTGGGSGANGQFTQARFTHDNATIGGCDNPRYRYLDFTVTGQTPGLLTLRLQPMGNQYQVVVQGGMATLSTAATGQKTTTDFERTTEYIPFNEKPVMNAQRFSVAVNSTAGTVVGTLVATDPDGGPLTYSVTGGTGQGVFAVNPTSGQLTVANSSRLDFEATPNFTLQVHVSDNGTPALSANATITIELTNVDEGAPAAPKNLRIR